MSRTDGRWVDWAVRPSGVYGQGPSQWGGMVGQEPSHWTGMVGQEPSHCGPAGTDWCGKDHVRRAGQDW